MSSDSKNDLGFVVDEFSELWQSMKFRLFKTLPAAGHLDYLRPFPAAGHIDTAKNKS